MNQSSGYDLFTTTWSPDGRVFQVEYAQKHVDGGSLSLALCCSDGIVLANEIKILHDTVKYPSPTFNTVHAIDSNVFISFCGSQPDGLCLVERARTEAANWKAQFGTTINAETSKSTSASSDSEDTLRSSIHVNELTISIPSFYPDYSSSADSLNDDQKSEDRQHWEEVRDGKLNRILDVAENMMKHNIDAIMTRNLEQKTIELEEAMFEMQVKVNRAKLFKRRDDRERVHVIEEEYMRYIFSRALVVTMTVVAICLIILGVNQFKKFKI